LGPLVEPEGGIERRAAGAIGHQLDGLEQAAAADITDVAVIAEPLGQPALQLSPELPDPLEQFFVLDDPLHFERSRAGERVREIGVSMLERARALPDGVDDVTACEHRADWLIAAAKSLGDGLDVGRNPLLLP